MAKPKLITGLFKNRLAAEAAVDAILKRGYSARRHQRVDV